MRVGRNRSALAGDVSPRRGAGSSSTLDVAMCSTVQKRSSCSTQKCDSSVTAIVSCFFVGFFLAMPTAVSHSSRSSEFAL